MKALVTGDFGRDYLVELPDHTPLTCSRKGRKQDATCGDWVEVTQTAPGQGRIESILPRRNVLFRRDAWREKTLAANIDQAVIILAPRPSFSENFLNLCLIACEAAIIKPLIVLNKKDLPEFEAAFQQLAHLQKIGYDILPLSAKFDVGPLLPHLAGKTNMLIGQSGMGKSRTINQLLLRDVAREGNLSEALDSGKHTTTYTRLYHLDGQTAIMDSPGLQSFGLFHLSDEDIAYAMPEFRPHIGRCKFNNCAHLNEPSCAIVQAHRHGDINTARLGFYQTLIEQQHALRQTHPDWKQ